MPQNCSHLQHRNGNFERCINIKQKFKWDNFGMKEFLHPLRFDPLSWSVGKASGRDGLQA